MVLPPRLIDAGAAAKRLFDGGGSWLEQAALAEMMQGPSYSTHVTRVRARYRENRDVLIAALKRNFGEVNVSGEDGGLHLLWRLPPGVPDANVVEALAAKRRIGVYSLASAGAMSLTPTLLDRRTLVIGFGAVTPKQIEQAIDLLSEIIDNSIDDPATDIAEFLIRLQDSRPSPSGAAAARPRILNSRFRRQPDLPKRPAKPAKLVAHEAGSGAAHGAGGRHLSVSRERPERAGPRGG